MTPGQYPAHGSCVIGYRDKALAAIFLLHRPAVGLS
jgi:hypothetical protein